MIEIIGPGRAGTAFHDRLIAYGEPARLLRRGEAASADADAVILAVPDAVTRDVARAVPAGPRLGTLAGSAALSALGDRPSRFILHPMQTLIVDGGSDQLDDVWVGITATDAETRTWARRLVDRMHLHALPIEDANRPLPHIACVFASNLLIGPLVAALRTFTAAGVPPAEAGRALLPLAIRAVENALAAGPDAVPTGPLARGDAATVEAHRAALLEVDPFLDEAYVALSRLALAQLDPAAASAVQGALTPCGEQLP